LACNCTLTQAPIPEYKTIHIYLFLNKKWEKIQRLFTRDEYYPEIVELTPYLERIKKERNIKIRLEFTSFHKVCFVGLDSSPQVSIKLKKYPLLQAWHSNFGSVTEKLNELNNMFVPLFPGEEIDLIFPIPEKASLKSRKISYVLISKGYYIPIHKVVNLQKVLTTI
jgi:hypothetical protein